MCIIACKPKGVEMPSDELIETMWTNNSDGAGIMWTENKMVNIEKGFMKLEELKEQLNKLKSRIDLKDISLIMHFRIATHGGVNQQNCHPFPIIENVEALQKLSFRTNLGVAHNGIINIVPRKNISDTMEYIISQLVPIKQLKKDFYKDNTCHKLIYNAITSKMSFLDDLGEIYTIGNFEEKDGILYSNSSYEPRIFNSIYDMWDDYYDKLNDFDLDVRKLMWLDDSEGYVKTNKGIIDDSNLYMIDKNNNVYLYDYDTDTAIKKIGYSALTHQGLTYKFDEDSASYVDVWLEPKIPMKLQTTTKPKTKTKTKTKIKM
jgi:hypothetical protein